MRWADGIVKAFAEHLARVGLEKCPVCSSGTLGVSKSPVELPWRGSPWLNPGDGGYDPQANILYMFLVVCDFCSHVMLFDSERFMSAGGPTLVPE